ncbi:MAG: hypothetical protein KYQ20_02300, partial [Candidatus Nealsonbacteria bacterium]|nr:hypothetical protein [Candidatus Nealsonbacteria bacterium]
MRTPEGRTETTRQETEEEKTPRTEKERDYVENINKEFQRREVWTEDLKSALKSLEKLEEERGEAVEQGKDGKETDIDRKIETTRQSIEYLVESITGEKVRAEINTDQEIAKRIIEEGVDARAKDAADAEFRRIVQEGGEEWDKICAEV